MRAPEAKPRSAGSFAGATRPSRLRKTVLRRFEEVTVPFEASTAVDGALDDLGRELLEAIGEMLEELARQVQ
jgi:hypothetical protein